MHILVEPASFFSQALFKILLAYKLSFLPFNQRCNETQALHALHLQADRQLPETYPFGV
jgi:hypothetical protein